jgi:two-component system OmpR family response regulator
MPQNPPRSIPRLLVVDDDELVLELITTRLELAGYDTYAARDGIQALQRAHQVRPQAMVLDLNMPRADGFEVLEAMARSPRTSEIPILVLTVRNRPEDVRTAIRLGAKDYLTKPFEDQQLLRRVARLTRKPRSKAPGRAASLELDD